MLIAWIAIFGALGTLARYGTSRLILPLEEFPLSTLAVNLGGSFLIGLLWGNSLRGESQPSDFTIAATTGFLGGFTTFSAFSLEVVRLVAQQKIGLAMLYASGSPALCIAMAGVGAWITRLLTAR